MTAASALYVGTVVHRRLRPKRHRLRSRVFWLLLDLDEMPALGRRLRLFGHNRAGIVSVHERDYGDRSATPLRAQIERHLAAGGFTSDGGPIRLLTMPRVLGYAFNPISVYFCHRRDGSLMAVLYEVTNTFGDRHSYLIDAENEESGGTIRQACAKRLHVSPLMDMDMSYDFRLRLPAEDVALAIAVRDSAGALIMSAALRGDRVPLTDAALARVLVTHPLLTFKVIGAIHWQALLIWLKGVRLRHRPPPPAQPVTTIRPTHRIAEPVSDEASSRPNHSYKARRTWSQRLGALSLGVVLAALKVGRLTVETPDGGHVVHDAAPGPAAVLVLHRWRALRRLLLGGGLGFAESYVDGDWTSPDLPALIEFAALNTTPRTRARRLPPLRPINRLRHLLRRNTLAGSRRNIRQHYDLGNAFYRLWLDDSMTYSSALFTNPDATLETAQAAKRARVAALLDLRGGEHVLEIGCGWGTLAAELAVGHGARVTGITLSPAQLAHAEAQISRDKLDEQVTLRLEDYRDTTGTFDRVVSIEMIEAVGEAYWTTYFDAVRGRLKEGGIAVIQAITLAEERFANYRRSADFVQRHIFPGGMLPSDDTIRDHAARAGLTLRSTEHFGASYAQTLKEWQNRFQAAWPAVEALGFDARFRRLWTYYLSYCEGGFRSGTIDVALYTFEG